MCIAQSSEETKAGMSAKAIICCVTYRGSLCRLTHFRSSRCAPTAKVSQSDFLLSLRRRFDRYIESYSSSKLHSCQQQKYEQQLAESLATKSQEARTCAVQAPVARFFCINASKARESAITATSRELVETCALQSMRLALVNVASI